MHEDPLLMVQKILCQKGSLTTKAISLAKCNACLRKKKRIQKISLSEKAEMALKEAVRGVIEDHARLGLPVVIWRNGKVARVPAGQLLRKRAYRT
jgi:hypothetical protein